MFMTPRSKRFRALFPVEHAFYFVDLQNNFVLSLQTGETLGYLVRIE